MSKAKQNRRIILTGGAGFIGSGVLRYLNEQGVDDVVVVDDLGATEKWKNLVQKQFVEIVPIQELFQWLRGRESEIRAFIHLGACSDTTETNAEYLLENNFRYSVRLAEYALSHGHRFLYASSAATYGDGSQGFSDAHEAIHSLQPLNMYGYSKQLFDQWVLRQGVAEQVVGLKYFNVFGPNEDHKGRMASAIRKLFPGVSRGESLKLFQSSSPDFPHGDQKRDFIYVKDAVRMTCAFLEISAGGIFNIGRGEATTWNRLGRALFQALGKKEKIEYIPMPEDLVGKYQNYTCADMNKTRKALDAEAECMGIEESVAEYVQQYLMPGQRW